MPETNFGEEEIQAMLDDVGRPITVAGVTVNGSIRRADEELLRAGGFTQLIGKAIQVTVKRGALPALAVGVSVIVDGVTYKAHSVMQSVNGVVTKVLCAVEQ